MGSTISSNISRIDVCKSPSGEEQSVVYSTPSSRTCTLRVNVGVDSACVSLSDYAFNWWEGTTVDISVRRQTNEGVGPVNVENRGNALELHRDASQFGISYGDPRVRVGLLFVARHYTTHGDALIVTHIFNSLAAAVDRIAVVIVKVWYDRWKGRFMYNFTGPSLHDSPFDATVAIRNAYTSNVADSTDQQTAIAGLLNNTGGPVLGDLNGSLISFFNFFFNSK